MGICIMENPDLAEFGHIPFFNNEILCHCGKRCCLETEASGTSLIRLFKEKIQSEFSSHLVSGAENLYEIKLQDIIEAARNDEMLSIELLAKMGEKIGKRLPVLINIFNPELVILGIPHKPVTW
jgi:predicted NBD/HSP70 family sugar kinase